MLDQRKTIAATGARLTVVIGEGDINVGAAGMIEEGGQQVDGAAQPAALPSCHCCCSQVCQTLAWLQLVHWDAVNPAQQIQALSARPFTSQGGDSNLDGAEEGGSEGDTFSLQPRGPWHCCCQALACNWHPPRTAIHPAGQSPCSQCCKE